MAGKLPAGGEEPGVRPLESGAAASDATPNLDVIEIAGATRPVSSRRTFKLPSM